MIDSRPPWIVTSNQLPADRLRCEYVVVGSGAGGGVAAQMLAESGKDVLVVEEGEYWAADTFSDNFSLGLRELYRNNGVVPFIGSPMVPFAEARCVGGGTTINGAMFWRTPSWVLDEWRYKYGLMGYGELDLAPHFIDLEKDLHVTRQPLDFENNRDSELLQKGAKSLGWKTSGVDRALVECKNVNLCPIGCAPCGKQSLINNYLPRLGAAGGSVLTGCRAVKIESVGGRAATMKVQLQESNGTKEVMIDFDHAIVAGGPIQSPLLIRRSGLSPKAGSGLQFHMNLKIIALFPDEVHADQGTMYTVQLQEFEREGILFMASNLLPHLLVTTAAHHGKKILNHLLTHFSRLGLYVAMIRAKSQGKVHKTPFGNDATVTFRFDSEDMTTIRTALKRSAKLLFSAGATELYLPISGSNGVHNLNELNILLDDLRPSDLEIVSVHAMSSCAIGIKRDSSIVSPAGNLWDAKNVMVTDASIVPTTTGESPQGTIMALAREVISRHISETD